MNKNKNTQIYDVKNCPSYFDGGCYGCDNLCQNIPNCLIKQIIEKVKNKALVGGICETAEEVFELFKIGR